jgi:lipopolysaccharide biosynthesis glycosyltransferase
MPSNSSQDSVLNVAFCADFKFFEGLEVSLCSLIFASHLKTKHFNLYIIDGGLKDNQKCNLVEKVERLSGRLSVDTVIEWIEFPPEYREQVASLPGHFSTYARLSLPDLIENQDWVLWVDADILCCKDLSGIEAYLSEEHVAAAVVDTIPTLAAENCKHETLNTAGLDLETPYFNAGLMVINLAQWRREALSERLLRWAHDHSQHLKLWDQTVLNWNLADRIQKLPNSYNILVFGSTWPAVIEMEKNPVNIHSIGKWKMWKPDEFTYQLKTASATFVLMVGSYYFFKFRMTELGYGYEVRMHELEKAVLRHPYQKSFWRSTVYYNLKIIWYRLTGNARKRSQWEEMYLLFKAHAGEAKNMLCSIVADLRDLQDRELGS